LIVHDFLLAWDVGTYYDTVFFGFFPAFGIFFRKKVFLREDTYIIQRKRGCVKGEGGYFAKRGRKGRRVRGGPSELG